MIAQPMEKSSWLIVPSHLASVLETDSELYKHSRECAGTLVFSAAGENLKRAVNAEASRLAAARATALSIPEPVRASHLRLLDLIRFDSPERAHSEDVIQLGIDVEDIAYFPSTVAPPRDPGAIEILVRSTGPRITPRSPIVHGLEQWSEHVVKRLAGSTAIHPLGLIDFPRSDAQAALERELAEQVAMISTKLVESKRLSDVNRFGAQLQEVEGRRRALREATPLRDLPGIWSSAENAVALRAHGAGDLRFLACCAVAELTTIALQSGEVGAVHLRQPVVDECCDEPPLVSR